MKTLLLFVRGVALGCMLAIPLGSASMMAVRDAMLQGFKVGFSAACAPMVWDFVLSTVMCFAMGWFIKKFTHLRPVFQIIASIILLYVAGQIYFDKTVLFSQTSGSLHSFVATFRIVVFNTGAIICSLLITIPLFGGEPFAKSSAYEKISFLGGIMTGDCVLWIVILLIAQEIGSLFVLNLAHVNSVFAAIIAVIAVVLIVKTYREFAH